MRIEKITSQNRRDFTADMICEHCGSKDKLKSGYDDHNYHSNVIPKMKCSSCGKAASDDYRPLQPKYDANVVI